MSAAILPFPAVRKGRIRNSRSMEAAGELTLYGMKVHGKEIPSNVVRHSTLIPREMPVITPELAFCVALFGQLEGAKQASVEYYLSQWSKERKGRPDHERAAALAFNLIRRDR